MQVKHVYATALKATVALAFTAILAHNAYAIDPKADTDGEAAKFTAYYHLTKVGLSGFNFDYNRITAPGAVLVVRVPGIYSDVANTKQAIVNTEVQDGSVKQAHGILAALSNTSNARELQPGETVYITKLDIKPGSGIVHMELLTTGQTQRGGWDSTRYRAEVNFHIPTLASAKAADVKAIIDSIVAEESIANAVQSKSVDIGMAPDQVKQILGNPDNIINLGPKTIFVYKNMKVIFIDAKVSDVQ
jgi:hypothetical protein